MFRTFESRQKAFEEIRGVYPVITAEFCGGRSPVEIAAAVLEGGAKIIQIREKEMPDAPFFELVTACRKLTLKYHALLIVDDRVDVALAANADGVHLGLDDLPPSAARRLAPELLIGLSTHNRQEMLAAQALNPGYLNIGPIYPTETKKLPYAAVGEEELARLLPAVKIPFTVMGGIKFHHLETLRSFGVCRVAAVTAFTQAADPAAAVRQWQEKLCDPR